MKKIFKYGLVAIMVLSLFINMLLFITIGYISIEYEDSCDIKALEWCEISNDLSLLVNDLLYELEYYNNGYSEVERLDIINCFGNEPIGDKE